MKRSLVLIAVTLALSACNSGQLPEKKKLENEKDKLSYAIGLNIGSSIKTVKDDVDLAVVAQGMSDAMHKDAKTYLLKQEEAQKVITDFTVKLQERESKKKAEAGKKNKEDGTKFLADTAKKPGVKKTASGLLYEVVQEGSGAKPAASDQVTVNYKGTLIDGTEFDSSYTRGEPASFPLNAVIPGWTEGLQLMSKGAKYKFYIPSNLGYGERGAGDKIGPDAVLVFEVELLSIGAQAPAGK